MRRDLMDVLVCPVCRSRLELTVEHEEGDEVVTGTLRYMACDERYPIAESVPDLLPPEFRA